MNFIDLFAGAGGLSEGFIRSGYIPLAHVEKDEAACNTLKTRIAYHYLKNENKLDHYVQYLKGSIDRKTLYSIIPQEKLDSVINLEISDKNNKRIQKVIDKKLDGNAVDLIIGGPPCQAYSIAGRSRSKSKMKGDPRNFLFREYAKYLSKYKPNALVFENVVGLKSAQGGQYLIQMKNLFCQIGYVIKLYTLHATDFGVLQNRKRIIIVGVKKNTGLVLPALEKVKIKHNFLVKDIFEDLPSLKAGEGENKFLKYPVKANNYLKKFSIRNDLEVLTQHVARPHSENDKNIYKIAVEKWEKESLRLNYNDLPKNLQTHKNTKSFVDRYKVVAQNLEYSHTVVAHISKDGHYYIHPDIVQNRSISVRESARLQSFPDDYYFEGRKENSNRTSAFKQIGNAVPPLMAEKIAALMRPIFNQEITKN